LQIFLQGLIAEGIAKIFGISFIFAIFAVDYLIYHIMFGPKTCSDKIITLGSRYKDYRRAIGVSQQDVHRRTGVALSTISLFENGRGQGLSLVHFYLLMEALDLEVDVAALIPEAHKSDLAKMWEQQNKGRKR
jgi:DNA-binding XRE family transcriptional regulator